MLLAQGRVLAQGTPAEVLTPAHLHAAYGLRVRVLHDGDRPLIVPED